MKKQESNNANFTDLSNNEKNQLKNRVTDSIYTYIQRKRFVKYAISIAAASVVGFFSVGIFNKINNNNNQFSIENFVRTTEGKNLEPLENVKLLLNGNQDIEIDDENSSIAYSSTGQEIKIGNEKSVNQDIIKDKNIVFNTLIVPYGKRSEIRLADGSKVWLNSGSKLIFPVSFIGKTREVYIEGEGIFEVAHDKNHPFIVKTSNHEIEVLGTVFNVSNYADDNAVNTVLQSGSVQISFKNNSFFNSKKSIKITPGTIAIYNKANKSLNTNEEDIEKYFSWREGIFIFKNDPLHIIMKKIARYYNIEIVINDASLANETFSGHLDVKDHVENVITTIKETTEFQYHIDDNKITIN
ncbi:FecR family protein [Flavivirga spongiicola]|uniref:DUF4974 domain-containing protein n=1 Tax=Flavivirga spongiicola TaxID=421621 RepID=A0ABU7XP42_9FLAO|nr:FecR domain-containing protein [Flavivirga sp. MEBiC05379]MDO5977306.1 DUF4974 domain-containing protein [Flavivirga sp. MEBiC05379]